VIVAAEAAPTVLSKICGSGFSRDYAPDNVNALISPAFPEGALHHASVGA